MGLDIRKRTMLGNEAVFIHPRHWMAEMPQHRIQRLMIRTSIMAWTTGKLDALSVIQAEGVALPLGSA
jgi:hypothetical protein